MIVDDQEGSPLGHCPSSLLPYCLPYLWVFVKKGGYCSLEEAAFKVDIPAAQPCEEPSAPSGFELQGRKVGAVQTKYDPTMAHEEGTCERVLLCIVHHLLLLVPPVFAYRSCERLVHSFQVPWSVVLVSNLLPHTTLAIRTADEP